VKSRSLIGYADLDANGSMGKDCKADSGSAFLNKREIVFLSTMENGVLRGRDARHAGGTLVAQLHQRSLPAP
jgi:hypothetical protein